MVSGRVVRFDSTKGYGFIAPDHGGEDVFMHVNDLRIPESLVHTGLAVEFEVEDGDRGLKASGVRLAEGAEVPQVEAVRVAADGEEPFSDVLSAEEYLAETTEVLLAADPTLTGRQISAVRGELLRLARKHGWTEG